LQEKVAIALEKQFLAKDRNGSCGLEVLIHMFIYPINEMDEMRFQNKVSLTTDRI
jgi:hypothetical protein